MSRIEIPETPNVSLVAFYEKEGKQKSDLFSQLIRDCQTDVCEELKDCGVADNFISYDTKQVHATILGCEGARAANRVLSKWFWEKRRDQRYLDFENLLKYFRWYSNLPIVIRFCGYSADTNYGFTSQDLHPHVRSFQIRDDNTAMLMGWPYRAGQWSLALDQFRLGAQKCNALHKFHTSAHSVDNDCYLRVGLFSAPLEPRVRERIQNRVRMSLARMAPIYEIIDHTTLRVARYQETTLELNKTDAWSLEAITASTMADLYPDASEVH